MVVDYMLEDERELQKITNKIVADILAANVAEKKIYTDERTGEEYWNLITPDAFDKKLIIIASLGYPECAGVWSYTLLQKSRLDESSKDDWLLSRARAADG